ncbi:HD domain-containing protein [Schwartzia sp. (in: firmicutes)]
MTEDLHQALNRLEAWMRQYMKSWYNEAEDIQQAIRMKEEHTMRVLGYARELSEHLGLAGDDVIRAEIMGLLHDVGRFRQFTIYRTFNDAQSEDHAALGLKTIADEGLISSLPEKDQEIIRFAIWNHNKKVIEPAPDKISLMYAKILRDADKLDIYHVLEPFIAPSDGTGISPDFVRKFTAGEQCDYTMIRTMDDRKLVRLMWVYDINYSWTMKRVLERGYIDKIVRCLPQGDAEIDKGVQRLREYVKEKCNSEDKAE